MSPPDDVRKLFGMRSNADEEDEQRPFRELALEREREKDNIESARNAAAPPKPPSRQAQAKTGADNA